MNRILNHSVACAVNLKIHIKKSLHCKAIILKHSKDFGGSLEDPEVIKLCGCSRNSYYKYKKEIKSGEVTI